MGSYELTRNTKRTSSPNMESCSSGKLAQRKCEQLRSGLTNLATDIHGRIIRVPLHKAPNQWGHGILIVRLPLAFSPQGLLSLQVHKPRQNPSGGPTVAGDICAGDKQQARVTYCRSSVRIAVSSPDQWRVQFAVSNAMVTAIIEGLMSEAIPRNGTHEQTGSWQNATMLPYV